MKIIYSDAGRGVIEKISADKFDIKAVLMNRNHMSEEEAHGYIQKCSMNSGMNMVETAQMVLAMMRS